MNLCVRDAQLMPTNQMFDSSISAFRLVLSTAGEAAMSMATRSDTEQRLQVRVRMKL